MTAALHMTDKRALLAGVGHRLVRKVAAESGPHAEALFGILAERKPGRKWDSREWALALDEIDSSTLTVSEWLARETTRGQAKPGRVINHSRFQPPEVVDDVGHDHYEL